MRRTLALLAGVVASALTLAACGAKVDATTPTASQDQTLTVMLDWFPNADHVGLYEALANGDFARAGLKVRIVVPSNDSTPLQLLSAGKVDVAFTYEPQLMLARDQGAFVAAIAAVVQRPLTSIISLGDKRITSPADLRGKTVGDAGIPYQTDFLQTILAHAGVPAHTVTEDDVGENLVPAMLSGRVDATIGGYWNYEALELRQDGRKVNVIHVEDAGVPDYDELVLAVREDEIANDGDELRRFVQALGRGYAAVRADPAAGVKALLAANPSLSSKLQTASVTATLPSFFPSGAGQPWGWQDQAQWNAFGDWMVREHLLSHPSVVADASTNQMLAGQGP